MDEGMKQLQVNHLEIAARAWANAKAREIGGIVAADAISKSGADIQALDLKAISEAEDYTRRFLAAWLNNCVIEFARTYYAAEEERLRAIADALTDKLTTQITSPVVLAASNAELLEALETLFDITPFATNDKDAEIRVRIRALIRKAKGE